MAGGFPFSNISRYATGQPKFVLNVGLVPEAASSLKCNWEPGMEGVTEGSISRCEASYSDLDASSGVQGLQYCCIPSSAGDHLVLDLSKSATNGTLMMLNAFKGNNRNSWNAHECRLSYMDAATCTAAASQSQPPEETVHIPNGQRAYGNEAKTTYTLPGRSHEFKPDDASSHNMLSKSSGDLDINDLAGFSESINECLLQEERTNGHQKAVPVQTATKGSKRKAADVMKKPAGAEVQSERKNHYESRIVRVSRLTGGKDRHSKVRTAKGLRDRRVRLSVSTAIQFYDLQDRLRLDQPSQAVDWLLKAAKPAIDELPVLHIEMLSASASASAAADAGSNWASSNCSPVKNGVGSRKENASPSVTELTGLEVGVNSAKKEKKFSKMQVNGLATIAPTKDSADVGRSSSSTSDGSIMGAEYTSKSSLSKLRLKEARERAKRKSASAKSPAGFSQPTQTNSLESSLPPQLMRVLGYTPFPLESQVGRADSPCGISNQVSSGTGNTQQLWDYSMPSYADIPYSDSRQLQRMGVLGSSMTAALQQSSSVPTSSMQPVLRSSHQVSYEMADSGINYCFDPKQRHMGGNAAHEIHINLINSNHHLQQEQQSQAMQKQFASTFVPAFTDEVNFSTSGLCSRGPLQSNSSSCITSTPLLQTQKNAYADASSKANMLPFYAYDARVVPERFQNIISDGKAKYEVNH